MRTVVLTASLFLASSSMAWPLSPADQALGQRGLSKIYEMDFSGAERDFRRMLEDSGGHPLGYFGLAGSVWTNLVYGSQEGDARLEAEFWKRADTAIRKSNEWLKTHPDDANAFLALGGSYGVESRLWVFKKQWLNAAVDGRRALKAMRQAHKLDPELYDVYLGLGTWEYYADVLPRFIKVLSKLLLGGDRELGIQHLRLAAEKARYVNVTASLILIEIYLTDRFGSRNPREALRVILDLRQRYPDSPLLLQIEQTSRFVAKDYDGLIHATKEYEGRIRARKPFYGQNHWPHVFISLGTMRMAQGDLKGAKEEFSKCLPYIGARDRPNQWALWGLIRLAQVEDALGEREAAQSHYRQALPCKDFWGYRALAAEAIKRPLSFDPSKLRLSPP